MSDTRQKAAFRFRNHDRPRQVERDREWRAVGVRRDANTVKSRVGGNNLHGVIARYPGGTQVARQLLDRASTAGDELGEIHTRSIMAWSCAGSAARPGAADEGGRLDGPHAANTVDTSIAAAGGLEIAGEQVAATDDDHVLQRPNVSFAAVTEIAGPHVRAIAIGQDHAKLRNTDCWNRRAGYASNRP